MKILIKNAVKRKKGYLYYIFNTDLCMCKFGNKRSDEYELEVRRAKYYFKLNSQSTKKK